MISELGSDQRSASEWAFNSVDASAFLSTQFPEVNMWTCWYPSGFHRRALASLVDSGACASSSGGSWKWTHMPCAYPNTRYWNGEGKGKDRHSGWVGVLRVERENGSGFLLFSFLDDEGRLGYKLMASTNDRVLLHEFAEDLDRHFFPRKDDSIEIPVFGGRPITMDTLTDEKVVLPAEMLRDIESQVYSFFNDTSAYQRFGIRHRRGFLFVGPPGVGKTMTVRRLIRECHRRYRASVSTITISRHLDESDLEAFFSEVSKRTPGIVIFEDLDSLTTECGVSRAAFLSQLDGFATVDGLLIIGTTNNPEKIDPALIHRPSRFDRVWHFPLPDYDMRVSYLVQAFESLDSIVIESLAERTEGWSYAYLNELRTTAAVMALNRGQDVIAPQVIVEACAMLDSQFQAGRKNHAVEPITGAVGFNLGIR